MDCVLCIIYTYLKCLQTSFPSLSPTDFFFFLCSIQQLLSAEEKVSSYGKIPSGEI